jgi:hypothetical protein
MLGTKKKEKKSSSPPPLFQNPPTHPKLKRKKNQGTLSAC